MNNKSEGVSVDASCISAERVAKIIKDSIAVKRQLLEVNLETVVNMADAMAQSIRNGGKVLLCGNGGSAADAQHLAAELLVRLRPHVNRSGIPAVALAADMSSLTACGNDYSFEYYYERMVEALGRPGDVLIGITTSGKSPNILSSLSAARKKGMTTIGLLGGDGGPALPLCDISLVVPSKETGRIQESHIVVGHAMMELVEDILLNGGVICHMDDNA